MEIITRISEDGPAAIIRFASAMGKSIAFTMRRAARKAARVLLALTPPTEKFSPNASFAQQRRAGLNAVESDVRALFQPIEEMSLLERPQNLDFAEALRGSLRSGNVEGTRALLSQADVVTDGSQRVISEPDKALHNRSRTRKGNVSRSAKRWPRYVMRKRKFNSFLAEKKKNVGTLMGGWVAFASKYGVKAPAWVTKHRKHGSVTSLEDRKDNPEIGGHNTVDYARVHNAGDRITRIAIKEALASLTRELEYRIKRDWGR